MDNLVSEQHTPYLVTVGAFDSAFEHRIVAKVFAQRALCRRHIIAIERVGDHISAAALHTIVHLYSNTHMVHQLGNSINLSLAAPPTDGVGHEVPLVGRVEVGALGTEVGRAVSVGAVSADRMVPILHHLSLGGGHATGDGMGLVGIGIGALLVVPWRLVPGGGHQRPHCLIEGCLGLLPHSLHRSAGCSAIFY